LGLCYAKSTPKEAGHFFHIEVIAADSNNNPIPMFVERWLLEYLAMREASLQFCIYRFTFT
jgi:hypothetical protein